MKIKLNKLVNAVPAFKILTTQATNAKTAYRLAKTLNTLQAELDVFENTKNKLLLNYQTTNEDGKTVISDENVELIKTQLTELLEEEIEININQIPISDLSGMSMTISNMMLIDFIFSE